jgi:hypothetical protein
MEAIHSKVATDLFEHIMTFFVDEVVKNQARTARPDL